MNFLANTDAKLAQFKGEVMRTEFMAKAAEALVYKSLDGSIEDRKQGVRLAPEVSAAWEANWKAVVEFEKLKARRERAFMTLEIWRSVEASRRRGNI